MAIDPANIELTNDQRERLAFLAEQQGRSYTEIVDEWLAGIPLVHENGTSKSSNAPQNLYEAFEAVGAIGCFDGPPDLSTNPKYMEGFGSNATSSDAN